jgi:hypothetical protein
MQTIALRAAVMGLYLFFLAEIARRNEFDSWLVVVLFVAPYLLFEIIWGRK